MMLLIPSTYNNTTTTGDDDKKIDPREYEDLGPCVSMAIEAQNEEQFLRLSYKLKRTTSLHMGRKPGTAGAATGDAECRPTKQFWKESRQCRTFALPSEETLRVKDDVSVGQGAPDKYVDYLSYRWNDFEVINSWKFIRLARKWCHERKTLQVDDGLKDDLKPSELYNRRQENMSWRIWFKLKLPMALQPTQNVKEILFNSMSNQDMTWLYGPLIHRDQSGSVASIQNINDTKNIQKKTPYIKPILKKRNLGETLEKNSLWRLRKVKRNIKRRSSLDYRHIRQHTRLNIPNTDRSASYFDDEPLIESNDSSNPSSSSTSSSFTGLAAITNQHSHPHNDNDNNDSTTHSPILDDIQPQLDVRHIRFSNNVQQCIAIHKSKSNLDSTELQKDIIQPLPPTQLNYYSGSESDSSSESCPDEDCDDCNKDTNVAYKHYSYIKNKSKSRSKAVSHNVNTSRRYPYIYDYNSVYTGDVSNLLPKDYSCDIIDLPQGLGLELSAPTQPIAIPSPTCETDILITSDETIILSPSATTPSLSPSHSIIVPSSAFSTPQTPLSSTFGYSSTTSTFSTEDTETSSVQALTKTRDFITGQLISSNSNSANDDDSNKGSPQLLDAMETPPTLFNPKFKTSPTALANFIFNSSDESDI